MYYCELRTKRHLKLEEFYLGAIGVSGDEGTEWPASDVLELS